MTSAMLDRMHRFLARSAVVTRVAIAVRNQCRAIIKYRLMTTHQVRDSGEQWLAAASGPRCRSFVDVGANRGEWTAMLLESAPQIGRAILFEPGRRAALMLRERFESLSAVEVVEVALSDHDEAEARFFEEPDAGNTSSLTRGASSPAAIETCVGVTTLAGEMTRLGIAEIDLLKIDAEGNDLAVLRGASPLLRERRVAVILWEYSEGWALAGSSLGGALELLRGFGYDSYLLKKDGLYRFDYDLFGEFLTYANFVSVPHGNLELTADLKELL